MEDVTYNVPKKILLVVRPENKYGTEFPQSFAVDPKNTKQIETARNWGSVNRAHEFSSAYEIVEPKECLFNNEGFTLTLFESAGYSSQGGKLSFMNCILEKDGISTILGIEQDNLLSLLKQSTVINGVVQEKLSIVKLPSSAGVLHPGMKEWKYIASQDKHTVHKTTKWQIGRIYFSKTKMSLYLGTLYRWFTVEEQIKPSTPSILRYNRQVTHYYLKKLKKPEIVHCTLSLEFYGNKGLCTDILSGKITNLEQLYNEINTKVENYRERMLDKGISCTNYYELGEALSIFGTYQEGILDKLISREEHEIQLDPTNHEELLNNYLNVTSDITKHVTNESHSVTCNWIINGIGYTTSNKEPIITDEWKELIANKTSVYTHIDFGDGKLINGRIGD